jgi:hypothetical protein
MYQKLTEDEHYQIGKELKEIKVKLIKIHILVANKIGKTKKASKELEKETMLGCHIDKARSELEEILMKEIANPRMDAKKYYYGQE